MQAFLFATTAIPLSLIENQDYTNPYKEAQRRYKIPFAHLLRNDILEMQSDCKKILMDRISRAKSRISLTGDIWSKKGLTVNKIYQLLFTALPLIIFYF